MDRDLASLRLDFWRDRETLQAAEAALKGLFEEAYPVDKYIAWRDGTRAVKTGHVVRHCFGFRVEVRNAATGKARIVHVGQVVNALRGEP